MVDNRVVYCIQDKKGRRLYSGRRVAYATPTRVRELKKGERIVPYVSLEDVQSFIITSILAVGPDNTLEVVKDIKNLRKIFNVKDC